MTPAWFLTHAAAVGLTCTAVVPVTVAVVRHNAAPRHHAPVRQKPRAAPAAAPACPPAGIAAIAALPAYAPPAMMDDDVELASPVGTRSYSVAPGAFAPSPIAGGGSAAASPTVPTSPTPSPASNLPEPGTWIMMLAGFAMIGAALRPRAVGAAELGDGM